MKELEIEYTEDIIPEKFYHDAIRFSGYPDAVSYKLFNGVMFAGLQDESQVVVVPIVVDNYKLKKIRFIIVAGTRALKFR